MGLKLHKLSELSPHSLTILVMATSLSVWGTESDLREKLIIVVMRGKMAKRQFLTRFDRMGSRLVKLQVQVGTQGRTETKAG